MEVKVFGVKLNLATIVVSLLVGLIIGGFTLCACSKITEKEGYSLRGAPTDYRLGVGVPGDKWDLPVATSSHVQQDLYASLANNIGGQVPLPDNQLTMFYDTKFTPDCCYKPQQYSSSTGCACISAEQMKYLSSRGGNNTLP